MLLCSKLHLCTNSWRQFYADNTNKRNADALLAQRFMKDMLDRARSNWWPSYNRLQIRLLRAGTHPTPEMTALKDAWVKFGNSLGLDATKERLRHEREVRNRCAWRECEFHRDKPDGVALLACKGCSEVRYCGRECQKAYVNSLKVSCVRTRR